MGLLVLFVYKGTNSYWTQEKIEVLIIILAGSFLSFAY